MMPYRGHVPAPVPPKRISLRRKPRRKLRSYHEAKQIESFVDGCILGVIIAVAIVLLLASVAHP